jgi:hypothetical protein
LIRLDLTPSGYFAAQASQIGISDEELLAIDASGKCPEDRLRIISQRLHIAATVLAESDTAGNC